LGVHQISRRIRGTDFVLQELSVPASASEFASLRR
jgi:hypothetical protein